MNVLENFKNLFLEIWQQGISGVNFTQIGLAIAIFLFFLLLRGLIAKFILQRLKNYVAETSNKFDDALVSASEGPVKFLPIVLGIFMATSYMDFEGKMSIFIDNINRSLITILIFWLIHQIVEPITFLIKRVEELLSRDLLNWVIKANKILIIFFGFAATLDIWGIKIAPIIAGLGLFGVAVALGAQDLFKNLISGILVLVEKRFKIGDWIYVEGIIEGIVERIGFRSTVIRKFDKSIATIPNSSFAENAVVNISETTNWRISWIITLQYSSTVEQLKNIRDQIEKFITTNKDFKIGEDTEHAIRIDKFSDSSIDMYIRCFTVTNEWSEWLKIKERLAVKIKEIVESNGASFAFPSTSIYVEKK
ncbi:MAG: mechanosensitive ion channel protein MscS [Candidatus Pelagibacter sp. TMED128]|nr:MAG: mechanosensitive ion channel protein MscS [Candidatus Pelagibacter sp. TMED128]|tara:strand:+ start:342 stop:1433 length:1092 start_codon:yes stop_codon:yes gene_type:complete